LKKVYINGELLAEDQAKISVFDHGFLYGDGVFEGIRVYGGKIFRLDQHLYRLRNSARSIMLTFPWSDEELTRATIETVRANQFQEAYIRMIISRGVGPMGLDPDKCEKPSLVIIATGIQMYPPECYEEGLKINFSSVERVSGRVLPPQAKTLNYLNNILAKIEALNTGVREAIMFNGEGYITECTADNIFIVRNGRVLTPPIHSGALPGVTRGVVIEICKDMDIPIDFPMMNRHDMFTAEECFLTGTGAEVIPVVEIDWRMVKTRQGTPVY